MGRTAKWVVSILVTMGVVLMAMQNCSQVEFAELQEEEMKKISDNNVFVVGSEPVNLGGEEGADDGAGAADDGAVDDDGSVSDNGAGDDDGSGERTTNAEADGDDGSGESVGTVACGSLSVRDVIIDILSIEVRTQGGQTYQLNIGSGPADLLDLANGIDFIPDQNMSINQLRVMLGTENYVLTIDDQVYPLRTSSQQNAGLIVLLDGRTDLAKDITYRLTMDFDPQFQVRRNGAECSLHPNVSATIE